MRILIASVGRFSPKHDAERQLFERYAARLPFPVELREVEERRPLPPTQRKQREAELLLSCVPADAVVVALDETGKALSSREFAKRLGAWRDDGRRQICFLIGGADGLTPQLRQKADFLWSLGPLTWPHLMVRGLVAEQLFRAHCLLSGHPYHRD